MLDATDMAILKALNQNSRIKISHLAQQVHLTPPAVNARIVSLEDAGIIQKYTTEVDPEKLGYYRQIFIQITPTQAEPTKYLAFIHHYRNFIRHHYRTTGEGNYLIEGGFHSREELNQFLKALSVLATYQISEVMEKLI